LANYQKARDCRNRSSEIRNPIPSIGGALTYLRLGAQSELVSCGLRQIAVFNGSDAKTPNSSGERNPMVTNKRSRLTILGLAFALIRFSLPQA